MSEFTFSELELAQAAASVGDALAALPQEEEPEHTFSPAFEKKMDALVLREKRRRSLRTVAGRAAAVVLAMLCGVGVWLTVDQPARASIFQWKREETEDTIYYRFFVEAPDRALPVYRPGWLPEGYEQDTVIEDETTQMLLYTDGERALTLVYHWLSENGVSMLMGTGSPITPVTVNGHEGHFYPAKDSDSCNDLVWIDEDMQIMFVLQAYLSKEDMMHIAESVYLVK